MEPHVSIFSDVACRLGEGPAYDPHSKKLFWFDILGKKLLEKSWPDGETVVHDLPLMASAVAVVDADRQLLMTETGLHLRDVGSGALTLHTPIEADNAGTRSNDCRVHPCGAFWVSTMGKGHEKGAGSIYWFFKGEFGLLYPGLTIPNSICFSSDGGTAYFTDTEQHALMRVACDPATGLPTGEPGLFFDQTGGEGYIDGSVVDADGNLWNARWGAGSLDCYSPQGRRLRSIALPAKQTSCPAFVGPQADRIAVTSAYQGLNAGARQKEPQAGRTFLVDLPVRGRFEPAVAL